MVAKKRLQASYTLGGIQMISAEVMADGLLVNSFVKAIHSAVDHGIWHSYFDIFRTLGFHDIVHMFNNNGPIIWKKVARQCRPFSPFLQQV